MCIANGLNDDRSTLAEVMAYKLIAPVHYPNQWSFWMSYSVIPPKSLIKYKQETYMSMG